MGKRKKKQAKRLRQQQLLARRPLLQTVVNAANTPLGRLVIAEAMLHAANLLVRRPAAATAAAAAVTAGSEATHAVRSGSRLADAAAALAHTVLNAAAERLNEAVPRSPGHRKTGPGPDGADRKGDGRPRSSRRHKEGDVPGAPRRSGSDDTARKKNAEAEGRH